MSYSATHKPALPLGRLNLTDVGVLAELRRDAGSHLARLTNPGSPWTFVAATDAAGAAQLASLTNYQGMPEDASLDASANGASSGFLNVRC